MQIHSLLHSACGLALDKMTPVFKHAIRSCLNGSRQLIQIRKSLSHSVHSSDQSKYNTILVSQPCKHVAHIELNRPKTKNAFGFESAKEFVQSLDELAEDSAIRCVILSGAGKDFTSGVDLKNFIGTHAEMQNTSDVARRSKILLRVIERLQAPFKRMDTFMKPIICVQHGICYGLGMELAACSDIRYCSRDTQMAIREVLIGIAADVGSLQKMPHLIGNKSLLNELIFTGRVLSTEEALSLGFVSSVLDTKEGAIEKALDVAKSIASRSPVAIQGSKQNIKFSADKSFTVGLDYNAVWNMSMLQSEDVEKAIAAILSKDDSVTYEDF